MPRRRCWARSMARSLVCCAGRLDGAISAKKVTITRGEMSIRGSPVNLMVSSIDEVLNEIGGNHSAATVQVDTVGVKAPAIRLGDLVGALAQQEDAEGIAVEGKKSEGC